MTGLIYSKICISHFFMPHMTGDIWLGKIWVGYNGIHKAMEVSLKILKNWGKFFFGMCFLIKIFHFFWKQVFGKHILGVRMFG